jgi:hypothetical protein
MNRLQRFSEFAARSKNEAEGEGQRREALVGDRIADDPYLQQYLRTSPFYIDKDDDGLLKWEQELEAAYQAELDWKIEMLDKKSWPTANDPVSRAALWFAILSYREELDKEIRYRLLRFLDSPYAHSSEVMEDIRRRLATDDEREEMRWDDAFHPKEAR